MGSIDGRRGAGGEAARRVEGDILAKQPADADDEFVHDAERALLKLSTPSLRCSEPARFTVPPSMLIVPVALSEMSPVPEVNVPPLCTFIVAVLKLAAPMVVVDAPVSVSGGTRAGDRHGARVCHGEPGHP